jgi:hypothetical protein
VKRFLLSTLAGLILLAAPAAAEHAPAHFWQVDMSQPAALINQRTFNVEFTTLSTDKDDDMLVQLYRDGSVIGSQTTTKDYGDSGDFGVTVPADGTYQFHLRAANGSEIKTTPAANVTVDTAAPGAPAYSGKTRSGNTYTLTFTAPDDGDTAEIRIYSSTSRSFTADAGSQVGAVAVAPGETRTFSYTAPDDRERFHALQAFDSAGNFSALVGDPNTTATQGTPAATGAASGSAAGAAAGETAGEVAGGDTAAADQQAAQPEGQVLGERVSEFAGNNWPYLLLVAAAALAAYYLLYRRPSRSNKKRR